MFDQNIGSTRDLISNSISSQISAYLPYIDLQDVSVTASPSEIDENSMSIRVSYYIPNNTVEQVFELNLNPDTAIGFY